MSDRDSRPAWRKLALVLAACVLLAAAWRYTPLSELVTAERINAWAQAMRQTRWSAIALVLAYTPAALIMFPRQLITLLAVIVFGPWLGFAYAATGVLIAALGGYAAGRWVKYEMVRRICGKHLDTVKDIAREHGVLTVFASNMSPVPPFAIQGMIAGALKVNVWHYGLGTLLSLLPGLVALAIFGRELAGVLEDPGKVSYWTMGITVAVFGAFIYGMKRWIAKRERERGEPAAHAPGEA